MGRDPRACPFFFTSLICFISSNLCVVVSMATSSNFKQEGFLLYTSPPLINTPSSALSQSPSPAASESRQAGKKRAPEPTIPGAEERDKGRSGRARVFVSFLFSTLWFPTSRVVVAREGAMSTSEETNKLDGKISRERRPDPVPPICAISSPHRPQQQK